MVNDRILYAWLQFAGRWDDKTISAKLAAIRQFEDFCDGKAFAKVTIADVVAFREHLKSSVEARTQKLAEADEKYAAALEIKPDYYKTLDNQGCPA